ncbi:hypothetical protein WJX74_004453 [Apatococcus lobatus]|uniref:Uncharacterized protein n=1 Tax=Apatococcus lobatus TaxID=904363 RepID=A0AAW1R051_9CHLO
MQRQVLTKNYVEVLHLPALSERIQELIVKWSGVQDTSFPTDAATAEAGWAMTVAVFYDKRKSTSFYKGVQVLNGVGSIRKSSVDTVYEHLDAQSVTHGRQGKLSVLPHGKRRPVTLTLQHSKGTQRFGVVGNKTPRPFWFDEGAVRAPAAAGADAEEEEGVYGGAVF